MPRKAPTRHESLESLHEAGLAMVLRSDLADQGFPFLLASGFLEELPGSLEVPESSVVVLALLDPHVNRGGPARDGRTLEH